jgi:hypothetical protein
VVDAIASWNDGWEAIVNMPRPLPIFQMAIAYGGGCLKRHRKHLFLQNHKRIKN